MKKAAVEQEESEDWDGEEMVPLPVDKELLTTLIDMGFPDTRARKVSYTLIDTLYPSNN